MEPMYYIGLDVHKRIISYCVKDSSGKIHAEGTIPATRFDLDRWIKTLPQPWTAAMEATMFTGWIYDHLKPHAAAIKVAHPLMLRAIAAAKKENDRIDARKICDCLRCDFLPVCYMASTAIRERRRILRYRDLLVRQMVQMKIKISTLLMAAGVSYNKERLHKAGYFRELLATNPDINDGLRSLLRLCRETVVRLSKTESALVRSLERDPLFETRRATHEHSRDWPDHRADLGLGSGRGTTLLLDQKGHQLLWTVRGGEEHRRHHATHPAIEATQQTSANHVDRSGQDGSALQPDAGSAVQQGKTERECQSSHTGGGLPDGGGSWEVPFPSARQGGTRSRLVLGRRSKDCSARRLPGLAVFGLGATA